MLNIPEIFKFLMNSSRISSILREFLPNSDLKSSNGSVPRRSNLSTQVHALGLLCLHHAAQVEAVDALWGVWLDAFPVREKKECVELLCRLVSERYAPLLGANLS